MNQTVLAYIYHHHQVLMLFRNKKENDINEGKWVGVGGHIEINESPEHALIREIKEETNLDVISYQLRGLLSFINGDYEEIIYLYTVNEVKGEIGECNEGELRYFDEEDILKLNMWEGDKYFLDLIKQNEPYFELTLIYNGDKLIEIRRTK